MGWESMVETVANVGQTLFTLLMATLVPSLIKIIRDQRAQRTFNLVSRAGVMASTAAAKAMWAAAKEAQNPESDGGNAITGVEREHIVKVGIEAGWAYVKQHAPGLVDEVLKTYGGEQAVRDAIEAKVRSSVAP